MIKKNGSCGLRAPANCIRTLSGTVSKKSSIFQCQKNLTINIPLLPKESNIFDEADEADHAQGLHQYSMQCKEAKNEIHQQKE